MNNNINVLTSLEIGDNVLVKYHRDISKIATYYGKENDKYCFKDIYGIFEFTEKYISSHLELTKID